ncbi:GntR family transcriptional regulator [Vibrio sp. 1-Bac 57]|uniref:GntR family transcriptional regulator n=1 Tax=Psychromonas sp. SA13A TaxID=2686346 RepID=UPI00140DFCA1|nr:GntR family transcriptional regulator [Psychromonas sp. SA13A]
MVKYLKIYETIKQRILEMEYRLNEKLPDGASLGKEFDCSELTIKKALDILVADGLVVRKRGSGSFVKRPLNTTTSHLHGTKANAIKHGKEVTSNNLKFEIVPADERIAERLNCNRGDLIYHIIRVRIIDSLPTVIEDTYMPVNILNGLTIEHTQDSIYSFITNQLKLKIHSSTMEISIVKANEIESENLNVPLNDKLVAVEQIVYLDNGDIFEYSISKHTTDTYHFSTNFVRL